MAQIRVRLPTRHAAVMAAELVSRIMPHVNVMYTCSFGKRFLFQIAILNCKNKAVHVEKLCMLGLCAIKTVHLSKSE